jgi:hypothetical protein
MSAETHDGVHRHPAPTGFIRKYIFQYRSQGHRHPVHHAGARRRAGRHDHVAADALNLSWPGTQLAHPGDTVSDRRARAA